MSKVLLIIGHSISSKGAYNRELDVSEFDYWDEYVSEQVAYWRCTVHEFLVVHRRSGSSYSQQMREVHQQGLAWGADCSVEFHFNGSTSKDEVEGHETLHYRGSSKGKALATQMDLAMDNNLNNRDRGLKPRGVDESGGYGLFVGKYPSILVEPFFNRNLPEYIIGGGGRDALNGAFFEFFSRLEL